MNIDKKIVTEFLFAICRPTGYKWQSKTLFLEIFDPRPLIVLKHFQLPVLGGQILSFCIDLNAS